MPELLLVERRISPAALVKLGWERIEKGAPFPRFRHRDGWLLEHCGHPTANYPYLLTNRVGSVILTGVIDHDDPLLGRAWPCVAWVAEWVDLRGAKWLDWTQQVTMDTVQLTAHRVILSKGCYHCRRTDFHQVGCIVALRLDREARDAARPVRFINVGRNVMQGDHCAAVACSGNMAKTIAIALNNRREAREKAG